MRIGKAKRWNLLKAVWEYFYPVTIAPAVKDPNFVKADGKTVMTQGEINQQVKESMADVIHYEVVQKVQYDGAVDGEQVQKLRRELSTTKADLTQKVTDANTANRELVNTANIENRNLVAQLAASVSYYATIKTI